MTALVFFDVDNTLVKGYTGFYTTIDLVRHGIIRRRHLPKSIWYACFANYYRDHVIEKMYAPAIADMAGTPVAHLLAIGRQCVERWVWKRLYAEAVAEIRRYKSTSVPVILLSSGPSMTIEGLAQKLEVAGAFAIGPVVKDGCVVNQFRQPICYKEGKRLAAEQLAERHRVSLRDCTFYTDSIADLSLLEQVGQPIIVNPDRELRRIAERRRWRLVQWQETISQRTISA